MSGYLSRYTSKYIRNPKPIDVFDTGSTAVQLHEE